MDNKTRIHSNCCIAADDKIILNHGGAIVLLIVFLFGNINALIFLKCTSKRHGWKPFYCFTGALMLTDLFGFVSTAPVVLTNHSSDFSGTISPTVCYYFNFCSSFAILSSAFIVCFMSFDRCLAITRPIVYHTVVNNHRTRNMLALIWLTSACVCALPLAGFGSAKQYYPGIWCFIGFINTDKTDQVYAFIFSVICSCVLLSTVIMNCIVIIALCRKSHGAKTGKKGGNNRDVFAVILLLVYVSVFGVCLTPLTVTMLANTGSGGTGTGRRELLVVILAMSNGIIDPWIYLFLRKENILACLRCCRSKLKRFRAWNSHEINTIARSNPDRNVSPPNSPSIKAETHRHD